MTITLSAATWTGNAHNCAQLHTPATLPIGNKVKSNLRVTLSFAIAETLKAKIACGLRAGYLRSLRQYLEMFARGRGDMPLNQIRVEHLDEWFASRNEALVTQKSNKGRLGSMFGFAMRRGWINDNPVQRMERIRTNEKVAEILTVRQSAKLLVATRIRKPAALAYLSLAMLSGVRPEELSGVKWSDLDLENAKVRIDGAVSKVRRRRLVPLEPAAVAWLRIAKELGATLPVSTITRKRYVRLPTRNWHIVKSMFPFP